MTFRHCHLLTFVHMHRGSRRRTPGADDRETSSRTHARVATGPPTLNGAIASLTGLRNSKVDGIQCSVFGTRGRGSRVSRRRRTRPRTMHAHPHRRHRTWHPRFRSRRSASGKGKGRRGEEVRTGAWVPGRVVRQFGRGGRAICRQMWAQARIVVSWAERDDDAG